MLKINKPWGYEEILEQNNNYVIKKLVINAGCRLSKQYHKKKLETLIPLTRHCYITLEQNVKEPKVNNLITITPGLIHRIAAPQDHNVTILEISTPELDDVVRIEDDYGRETK